MTTPALTLPRPGSTLLTDTDRDLIRMLADGLSLRQIAARLGVSFSVVGNRLSRLYARTGTSNSTHLVATALRSGWLDTPAEPTPAALRMLAERANPSDEEDRTR